LYEEERAEKRLGRADSWSRLGEDGHAYMSKVSVRVGYPVADNPGRDAGTATLRFRLDERAKFS